MYIPRSGWQAGMIMMAAFGALLLLLITTTDNNETNCYTTATTTTTTTPNDNDKANCYTTATTATTTYDHNNNNNISNDSTSGGALRGIYIYIHTYNYIGALLLSGIPVLQQFALLLALIYILYTYIHTYIFSRQDSSLPSERSRVRVLALWLNGLGVRPIQRL